MSRITDFFNTSFAAIVPRASTIFNGVNELVNVGNVSALAFDRLDPVSFFAFCYPKDTGANGIVNKREDGGIFRGFELRFNNGRINLAIVSIVSINQIFLETTNTYAINNWYNVGFSYDGSSDISGVTIYVNGVSVPFTNLSNSLSGTIATSAHFQIGTSRQNVNYFNGNIAQCTFIGKEVSSSEALEIYNGGVPTDMSAVSFSSDVVSAWNLDASDNLTTSGGVTDYIGGHDGTAINMTAANTDFTNFPT